MSTTITLAVHAKTFVIVSLKKTYLQPFLQTLSEFPGKVYLITQEGRTWTVYTLVENTLRPGTWSEMRN
jgi:hypothetical protein